MPDFRPDCDMNARDAGGNTPLMSAAICGRTKMLETFLRDVDRAKQVIKNISRKYFFNIDPSDLYFFQQIYLFSKCRHISDLYFKCAFDVSS